MTTDFVRRNELPGIIAAALREAKPRDVTRVGTVTAIDSEAGWAQVLLDGDESEDTAAAQIVGLAPDIEDRVLVLFDPPGCYLIGTLAEREADTSAVTVPEAFLKAFDDGTGIGLTNNTFHTLAFNAPIANNTKTEDITIDSGIPTVNVDGEYAITLWFGALSDTAADTFDFVQLQLAIDLAIPGPAPFRAAPVLLDTHAPALDIANKHFGETTFTWQGFCPAGSTLEAKAKMSGDAGTTWSVWSGVLFIERVG